MSLRVLIAPDKFKGTLTAAEVASAIARGWKKTRPQDRITKLPMSDGGDGFGEVLAGLFSARPQRVRTVDAAHRPLNATWWWEQRSRTAVIESAKVIGLAMLPHGKYHPFELDTYGLGAVLRAALRKGARRCLIGVGGSATNDGGFGLARALGWKFLDGGGTEIEVWTGLSKLKRIQAPESWERGRSREGKTTLRNCGLRIADCGFGKATPNEIQGTVRRSLGIHEVIVAVDVQNRLLGPHGCTRVYGLQKGLRPGDFRRAESALRRLADLTRRNWGYDFGKIPGAGAAGGLGFGLMAFAGAVSESGFGIFAEGAQLEKWIRRSDVVVTGEGSLDRSTLMGKGVGEVAALCRKLCRPCIGIGGRAGDRRSLQRRFTHALALVDFTNPERAMLEPARWLEIAAAHAAGQLAHDSKSSLRSGRYLQ